MPRVDQRRRLVNSPNVFFGSPSQRADLLDPAKTTDELVALAIELAALGNYYQFTSVNSDHHSDLTLGQHGHTAGRAFDCWPLKSRRAYDWAEPRSPQMTKILMTFARSKWANRACLGGAAFCSLNLGTLGDLGVVDQDGDQDHIHFQADRNGYTP